MALPLLSKAELRRAMTERLASLSPAAARHGAARVAERLLGHPEMAAARRILTCLSFGSELDTWPLVEALTGQGRQLFVPRADPRDRQIHVHPYPCELVTLEFGLRQPPRGAPELAGAEIDSTVDLVLVLGLAFDRAGYRLGHGSGYFDRFLAAHPLPAFGLAYDIQLLDKLPREAHDLPMHCIVTESAVVSGAGAC